MSSRFALIQFLSNRVTVRDPPFAKMSVFAASSITKLRLSSLLDDVSPVGAFTMTHPCRCAMQIGARQHKSRYNSDHDCRHSASCQPPAREEVHGRSSGGTAQLCHKISPSACNLLKRVTNPLPSLNQATAYRQTLQNP